MLKIIFISLLFIVLGFLFLQGRLHQKEDIIPIFLKTDSIANIHNTIIDIKVKSLYKPTTVEIESLKKDYSNLWAHLNYLYTTNDIIAGKEYYTESWFRQLAYHYPSKKESTINRLDESHQINIINWASDGLVCTIEDCCRLRYDYKNKNCKNTITNLAVVLLYQGDHWRIDALKLLSEKNY